MSTNVLQIPKSRGALLLFSGMYLFFVSLVLTPFITLPLFSSADVTTKLFLVFSAAIISLLQLLFYVPKISRVFIRELPKFVKAGAVALLVLFILGILFSPAPLTALGGMYSMWEHNLVTYIVFGVLFLAWYVYFHLLTHLRIQGLVFHSLLTLLLLITIIYGIGSYYIWDINNEYVSNSVARLSLSFRNPLLAAYFIGMLTGFQFTRTLLALLKQLQERSGFGTVLLHLLLFAGSAYVLILTFTRSAWISTGITGIISIIGVLYVSYKEETLKETLGRIIVATLLLCALIYPFLSLHKKDIAQRNTDLLAESQNTLTAVADTVGSAADTTTALTNFYQKSASYSSAEIRLLEWEWGIRTVFATPRNILLGVGPDNAYFEMPKYREAEFNNIPIDSGVKPFYVRNIYITYLVEHGLIATIIMAVLLSTGTIFLLKELPMQKGLLLPLSLILGFFLQGLFYYATLIPTVLLVFGVSFTMSQVTDFGKISLRIPTNTEKAGILLLAILLSLWLYVVITTERTLAFYKVTPLPPTYEIAEKNARLPLNNNILKRYLVYIYPGKESARKYMTTMLTSNDPDDLRITSDALYKLAKEFEDPYALADAITTTERLLKITPTYPVPWDELGLRYLYAKDFEKAKASFLKAIELKDDYWYAYMHLGETSRQQCNPEEAITWYKKAEQYIPSAENEILEAQLEVVDPPVECK